MTQLTYASTLGEICTVVMKSPLYCQYPIACISEWIRPAILLDQFSIFRDTSGNAVGYMTWAFLSEDTERRLIADPNVLFHISEWNEGDRLWIMDFVVVNGEAKRFIRVAQQFFPIFAEAKSLRRLDDGTVRKITRWRRVGAT